MSLSNFEFWLMCGLISVLIIVVGWFLSALISEVKGLRTEMGAMNEKLAAVITNQDWHGKELARLDTRLSKLEDR